MKIAHVCNWTPLGCGMYETAREMVVYERRAGVDARMVDAKGLEQPPQRVRPTGHPCQRCGNQPLEVVTVEPPAPDWGEDRGVVLAPQAWLDDCDLIVSHSGMPNIQLGRAKPRVHVAHGRPRSSFLLGSVSGNHVWKAYQEYARDERFRALVTLWPGFGDYWRMVFPREVLEVPPFLDLARWTPGPSGYGFGGLGGRPNVVVADVWRQDRDPFHVVFGFARFAEGVPEARLHLYGLEPAAVNALSPVLDGLHGRGVLGEVKGRVDNLVEVYRAADLLITPHRMAVRTVREALACGLPVVAGAGNAYTPFRADDEDVVAYAAEVGRAWGIISEHREARREDARRAAEIAFDPTRSVSTLVSLYERVLSEDRKARAA